MDDEHPRSQSPIERCRTPHLGSCRGSPTGTTPRTGTTRTGSTGTGSTGTTPGTGTEEAPLVPHNPNIRQQVHNVSVQSLPPSTPNPKKRFSHTAKYTRPMGDGNVQRIPVRRPLRKRRKFLGIF